MKYNILGYLIGEGFRNVFKNKKSTFACLAIMCATMLIFGIFFVIGKNINNAINQIESSQAIEVFIDNDATDEEIEKLGQEILEIDGVNTIQFKTKEQALNQMKEILKSDQDILNGMDIFPASYIVKLTDLTLSSQVQDEINKLDNVKNINSSDSTSAKLVSIGNTINIITAIILVLLILISIFIIGNTIKLTVHARRKEISIMKYIGATNSFIRAPFVVEGIIIGTMASLISVLLIGLAYNMISNRIIGSSLNNIIGFNLLNFNELFNLIIIVYIVLGIGIGILGSAMSMRKYLKV